MPRHMGVQRGLTPLGTCRGPQMSQSWHLPSLLSPGALRSCCPIIGVPQPPGSRSPARGQRAGHEPPVLAHPCLVQTSGLFASLLLSPHRTHRSGRISKFPPDSAAGDVATRRCAKAATSPGSDSSFGSCGSSAACERRSRPHLREAQPQAPQRRRCWLAPLALPWLPGG